MKRIETAEQYDAVRMQVNELIQEATEKGMLESEADNEYTRETGRLSYMGAKRPISMRIAKNYTNR
jgi:hypothetical protein